MDAAQLDAIISDITAHGNASRALRDHNVKRGTLYDFFKTHPEAADRYARAKRDGIEAEAEKLIDLSDDASIAADDKRIRVDVRKFLLAKLLPKVYGDRVELEHTASADFAQILQAARKRIDP